MTLTKYKVHFSGKGTADVPAPYIKITATGSEGWNDFLYNFQAHIEINPGDGRKPFSASAYVMPNSMEKHGRRLNTWIASSDCPDPLNFPYPPSAKEDESHEFTFFTLLDDYRNYQKLTSWSSSGEERYAILNNLNDVVFLRNWGSPKNKLMEILGRPSFILGVLRSASAYRALRRGWRSMHAQAVEYLQDARIPFRFMCYLHGYDGGAHDLAVKFTESGLFEDRIHSLIGVNGSGKTRFLRELVLMQGRNIQKDEIVSVFTSDDASEAEGESLYDGTFFNRVVVFSSDSEMRFPPTARSDTAFEYHHVNLAGANGFELGDRWTLGSNSQYKEDPLSAIIVDMLRDKETFSKQNDAIQLTRFDLLRRAMRDHVDLDTLYLPLQRREGASTIGVTIDESLNPWVKAVDLVRANEQRFLELAAQIDEEAELAFFTINKDGTAIRQMYLSSGQKMFFRFAVRLISLIDCGTLVIIDEPETHLHPKLICDFVSLLYEVLIQMKSIAIIATHSAYVVRETPTHCVHVFNFDENSRRVSIGPVRLRTLGASIDSISQAVFGDATVRKYHDIIAADIANSESSLAEVLAKYEAIMSSELLIEIRAAMEIEGKS